MTKEKPILFSGEMVRAVIDGRKTQTRRPVKLFAYDDPNEGQPIIERAFIDPSYMKPELGNVPCLKVPYTDETTQRHFPDWEPGTRLWIRETWATCAECNTINYAATVNKPRQCSGCDETLGHWRPSIHMKREYSRLTLEITDIRVERLNDISEDDAKAEGAEFGFWHEESGAFATPTDEDDEDNSSYRDGFGFLWESIYGKGSWKANPFVWALSFRVLTKEKE